MSRGAYYNENDPFAAAWLRELISCGAIQDGEVDDRSIHDVRADDLRGFSQHHFFAGIGGWAYALQLAEWPDDRPVWTGSCPCQPFSVAGNRRGQSDERHLWPEWFRLISQCRPSIVFGEQVASPDGLTWLDAVSADLEDAGYAFGAADLCAAGVGAPHIRQRLYFVGMADAECRAAERSGLYVDGSAGGNPGSEEKRERLRDDVRYGCNPEWLEHPPSDGRVARWTESGGRGVICRCSDGRLGDSSLDEIGTCDGESRPGVNKQIQTGGSGLPFGLDHTTSTRPNDSGKHVCGWAPSAARFEQSGPFSFWSGAIWLPCSDGKYRPTKPGVFPLASGVPRRVDVLRGAGNSIVPEVAAAFIRATQ